MNTEKKNEIIKKSIIKKIIYKVPIFAFWGGVISISLGLCFYKALKNPKFYAYVYKKLK